MGFVKVCDIDLKSKWNDYPHDELYLWNGETIFRIAEGDGSNLDTEDIKNGYADYWMTDYISDGYCDGGQWLETEMIGEIDYTIEEVLDRMMEYDLWSDEWEILDHDFGEELFDAMEERL